ncbi:hypothetical protein ALP8811_00797 [Aliiroseovarius pelagivivens]|uniref:Glyceraldehyde-3-phosphate dehydrogenase n=1 Tax=Aliiroseovarius pelagivivens TaxID=1639690 RepID=A0A2R8AIB8_9RHOB|nr:hypothetical protein [Aliiroseovarius pelagivivens]SPF75803.1 hypothetical protein ALP8811_00797 [Aliiroseovarius pelagivivens]
MTNQLAIILGAMILLLVGLDVFVWDAENLLFLAKKFLDLTEWAAFWR